MRESLSEGTIYFSSQTRTEKCCKIITKIGAYLSVQIIPDKSGLRGRIALHFSVWTISFHNVRQAGTQQVMSFCQPLASTFSLWSVHTRQPRDKTGLTFRMTSIREEMSFFGKTDLKVSSSAELN